MHLCFLHIRIPSNSNSDDRFHSFQNGIQFLSSSLSGVEWSLDNDASNAAVLVASEAHAVTLAIEGLLGVVFTVATLTDEAVDVGEVTLHFLILFISVLNSYVT